MIADHRQTYVSKLRATLSVLVVPVQYAVDGPLKLVGWLESSMASRQALIAENTHLRYRQLMLESELQKFITLKNENKQLRELLKSSPRENTKVVAAQLLAVDTDPYSQFIILDKGQNEGVFVGQAVLDAQGVMGQVVETGPLTSTVLLINDPKSAVPVQNDRTGERAILVGTDRLDDLSLINLPKTALIKVGDLLVTSGLGRRFPEGYPIGRVMTISQNAGDPFIRIRVKATAHLNQSRVMLLVWPNEQDKRLNAQLSARYHVSKKG